MPRRLGGGEVAEVELRVADAAHVERSLEEVDAALPTALAEGHDGLVVPVAPVVGRALHESPHVLLGLGQRPQGPRGDGVELNKKKDEDITS